jgi:hypothetical protein
MRRDRYETTLSFAVSLIGRMQHGAGGGLDGLFFSRTNGSGSDAALRWCCRAASGRKQLAAWTSRGWPVRGGSGIAAGAALSSGWRRWFDRAGRSFVAELIRAIARARPAVLKYDQCVPKHRSRAKPQRRQGKWPLRLGGFARGSDAYFPVGDHFDFRVKAPDRRFESNAGGTWPSAAY